MNKKREIPRQELETSLATTAGQAPVSGSGVQEIDVNNHSNSHDKLKASVEIIGLIVLIVYTVFAGLQWQQIRWTNLLTSKALDSSNVTLQQTTTKMQLQIDASNHLVEEARKQSDYIATLKINSSLQVIAAHRLVDEQNRLINVNSKQMEMSQRPVINSTPSVNGPMVFDGSGAHLSIALQVANEGLSVANNVGLYAELLPLSVNRDELAREEEATCQKAERTMFYSKKTIFRGSPASSIRRITYKQADIERSTFGPAFTPNLIVCSVYQSETLNTKYRSVEAYIVERKIDQNPYSFVAFDSKSRQTVPANQIRLGSLFDSSVDEAP